jgi:hypothetical protein
MKIEVYNRFTPDGKEYYEWSLWDGPADCSDHARGYASDLIASFAKILEWRERIAADYAAEIFPDIENAKQPSTTDINNETN